MCMYVISTKIVNAYSVIAIVTVIVSSSGATGWSGDGFISTAYALPSVYTSYVHT